MCSVLQVALASEQNDHATLQSTVRAVCDAFGTDGELPEGSSLKSRLKTFYERVHVSFREALHTGVKRALAIVKSYYVVNLTAINEGFMEVPQEELEALDDAAEGPGAILAEKFEEDVVRPSLNL